MHNRQGDSPRPDMARSGSSRPSLRIRRLQPLANGRMHRGALERVPEDQPLAPLPADPPARGGLRSKLGLRAERDAEKDAERANKVAAIGEALRPGEVATVIRDDHGRPVLAAAPEALVSPPQDGSAPITGSHPDPHTSVALPADPPARNEPVVVTEVPETPRQKWWPFGRKKGGEDMEKTPQSIARDYGAADGPVEPGPIHNGQYAEDIVDWLDVIDPEVATVSTLSNIQNSLFLPDFGNLYNRMPIIDLSRRNRKRPAERRDAQYRMREVQHVSAFAEPTEVERQQNETADDPHRDADGQRWVDLGTPQGTPRPEDSPEISRARPEPQPWTSRRRADSDVSDASATSEPHSEASGESDDEVRRRERLMRSMSTIRGEYAVLPAGIAWDNWSEEEKAELDDHVRHLMHSRRERFRRRARGFRKFVSRPVGFLITLYAFLITFWGAAWVLFLIGWIYLGDRRGYIIEVSDQVLTALFCVVGIGLAPFRAVDTYHMIFIAHYHHLTWRLRREQNLPKLKDENDLPAPAVLDPDLEAQFKKPEAPVLTAAQQETLTYHQMKYHKSHTFYRPHETPTHRAFPLSLLIAVTVLLDCHSCLQMALGGTTWGIYYKRRPSALTATILSCSISCNITAGLLISYGGRRTRKVEEVEKRLRQALTAEAMRRMEEQKREEARAARGEPVGLQRSIARRVDGVRDKLAPAPSRPSEHSETRPLTKTASGRSPELEVPESAMEPALP